MKMSYFEKFDKKEIIIPRTIEIDCRFYELLEKLSNEKYDASINKLVNASVEMLIKEGETFLIKNWDKYQSIEKYEKEQISAPFFIVILPQNRQKFKTGIHFTAML